MAAKRKQTKKRPTQKRDKRKNVTAGSKSREGKHVCTGRCRHKCGEFGGKTARGKACTKRVAYGELCTAHSDQEVFRLPPGLEDVLNQLPVKRRNFVAAYCGEARGNQTEACRIAGYQGDNSSLTVIGNKLMRDPQVRRAVEVWMTTFAMSAAELTHRITDLARVNPGPFVEVDPDTQVLKWHVTEEAWEQYKHWVKKVRWDKYGNIELELHDAQVAMRDLARILRLWSDQPILNVALVVQEMSDEQIEKELAEARMQARLASTPQRN